MSKSIYLSPSAQDKNLGAGNYGTEEKVMNKVCDVVEKVLKRHGVKTYRNSPSMTLQEIVKDSNSKKPTIHFAIHSNAFNMLSRGCEVFCWKKGCEGEKLAKIIYNKISQITPSGDRGVKYGYNFYGIGKHMYEVASTTADTVLIEIAFHDNKQDSIWITSNINLIGEEIAKGLLEYIGVKYLEVLKPLVKDYKAILKEVSDFDNVWVSFIKSHPEVNLPGLIQKLYYTSSKK
jgi:N-acetylmuramoyl-L-alanine amidase